jgi:hypothetical protein
MRSSLRLLCRTLATASALAALGLLLASNSWAAGTPVSVFPIAGSHLANPATQITFRGLPVSQLGSITVTGSQTGAHGGTLKSDSDNRGGSFIPDKPFAAGEVVTVATNLNIVGGSNGTFHFTVSSPAGKIPFRPFGPAARAPGDVLHFHSYPQISPAAVRVVRSPSHTAHGYIFLSPWWGPLQNGPMVLDSDGKLVWFKAVPSGDMASDVQVQSYQGQPVLTYWQGYFGAGFGSGEDVINNLAYQQIDTVKAGNGLTADLHAFALTPQGTALILAEYPVRFNASSIHGAANQIVFDAVVQEIDIPTGLVLFQWDSLDHVPLNQSYTKVPKSSGTPYDFMHANSIQQDADGNLILSGRSTAAIYKIDHSTGHIIWTLGGKHSSFNFASGSEPIFQHDAVMHGSSDSQLSVFDNGAGLYNVHKQSRALWLNINQAKKTVTEKRELDHSPSLLAQWGGSVQQLPGGDTFVGWGVKNYFSEFNSSGQMNFDARFVGNNVSYRTFRYHWTGEPNTVPRVAASNGGGRTTVWVSWNGDTATKRWRVLAGSSSTSLKTVASAKRSNFETAIRISAANYVQVQALAGSGRVLSTSAVTRT